MQSYLKSPRKGVFSIILQDKYSHTEPRHCRRLVYYGRKLLNDSKPLRMKSSARRFFPESRRKGSLAALVQAGAQAAEVALVEVQVAVLVPGEMKR